MNEDSEQSRRASAAAIRYLSRRPRSEAEVRSRLRREHPPDAVDAAVSALTEQGLIDDGAFARLWAQSRVNNKPRSAWMVKRELLAKGVASHIAEDAVSEYDDSDNAQRAAEAYARRLARADYDAFHRRLFGYMRRRGFSAADSRRIAAELWQRRATDPQPHAQRPAPSRAAAPQRGAPGATKRGRLP